MNKMFDIYIAWTALMLSALLLPAALLHMINNKLAAFISINNVLAATLIIMYTSIVVMHFDSEKHKEEEKNEFE